MTDVVPYAAEPLSERIAYAEALSRAADLIPKGLRSIIRDPETNAAKGEAPNPGKVLLVLETGAMLGLHPVAALQGIHVIEGKATLSAAMMAAVVRSKGHRLLLDKTGTGTEFVVTATLVRADDPEHPYKATWNHDRAARAELVGKDNWRHYFEAMATNRAISEVCREGAPDALYGVVYTAEELDAPVDGRGDVIEATLESTEPTEPAKPPTRKRATVGTQGTKRTRKPTEDVVDAEVVEPDPDPEPGPAPTEEELAASRTYIADDKGSHTEDAHGNVVPGSERMRDGEGNLSAEQERSEAQAFMDAAGDDRGTPAVLEPDPEPTPAASDWTEPEARLSAAEWEMKAREAQNTVELRACWDGAIADGVLTTELKSVIQGLKGILDSKAAAAADAAATE